MDTKGYTKTFTEEAKALLVGRTIKSVKYQPNPSDLPGKVLVITFDNDLTIWAMADEEGNGGGALWGITPTNDSVLFPVL